MNLSEGCKNAGDVTKKLETQCYRRKFPCAFPPVVEKDLRDLSEIEEGDRAYLQRHQDAHWCK